MAISTIGVLGAQNRSAHGLAATFTDTEVLGHLNEAGRADVDHQLGINRVLRPLGRIGQVRASAPPDFQVDAHNDLVISIEVAS